jgi:hypothetical protein
MKNHTVRYVFILTLCASAHAEALNGKAKWVLDDESDDSDEASLSLSRNSIGIEQDSDNGDLDYGKEYVWYPGRNNEPPQDKRIRGTVKPWYGWTVIMGTLSANPLSNGSVSGAGAIEFDFSAGTTNFASHSGSFASPNYNVSIVGDASSSYVGAYGYNGSVAVQGGASAGVTDLGASGQGFINGAATYGNLETQSLSGGGQLMGRQSVTSVSKFKIFGYDKTEQTETEDSYSISLIMSTAWSGQVSCADARQMSITVEESFDPTSVDLN